MPKSIKFAATTEMAAVAEALRHGRYETRVESLPNDEVGRLGDTLNRLGNDLRKLERVRRDFVANVSHEIKTPLTSIKGYVETLLGGALDDPHYNVNFLNKIERNVTRLEYLVQDILSLAKIESEEGLITLEPTDWEPIIESVLTRHEDSISQKNIHLKILGSRQSLVVMGDREAMTQIFDNLISNAIKYTGKGGKIQVSLRRIHRQGILEVEDTGLGIPAKHLDRIFERFYRVDKARSREMGGTGLGLSIVKHLVSGMHGQVGVESEVGQGSKFSVSLSLPG